MLMLLCAYVPIVQLSSKLYDCSSLNHLSCTLVSAWELVLLSIIGDEPQCL